MSLNLIDNSFVICNLNQFAQNITAVCRNNNVIDSLYLKLVITVNSSLILYDELDVPSCQGYASCQLTSVIWDEFNSIPNINCLQADLNFNCLSRKSLFYFLFPYYFTYSCLLVFTETIIAVSLFKKGLVNPKMN